MMMGGAPMMAMGPNGPVMLGQPSGFAAMPAGMEGLASEPVLATVFVGRIPLIDVDNAFMERLFRVGRCRLRTLLTVVAPDLRQI
jgi:hypothetical protein